MIANYHTHTPRCRHAKGTEEEYIQNALTAGLEVLGFSDHTPYPFKNGYYSKMRMFPEQLPEYAETIRALQSKYADRLQIHLGLETEYYPAHFSELLGWVRDNGIEYMILGQHWLGNEQDETHVMHAFDDKARLVRCCDQTIEAIQTGVFSYLAHPDLPNFVGEERIYDEQMGRVIREAKACGMPLEINLHGARLGCTYPNPHFWELVAQEGCDVVLGRDAHDPSELLDPETEARMMDMVNKLGLRLVPKIRLVRP